METNVIEYISTSDVDLVKRFVKVAPTKYLVSLVTNAHPRFGYWDGAKLPVIAKWSFSKEENYKFVIYDLDVITDELKNRPNIKHSNKPDSREITCNSCGHILEIKSCNHILEIKGRNKIYNVFDGPKNDFFKHFNIGAPLYKGIKPEYVGKHLCICFDCPECGENIKVKIS